jgi:hypothetical protein
VLAGAFGKLGRHRTPGHALGRTSELAAGDMPNISSIPRKSLKSTRPPPYRPQKMKVALSITVRILSRRPSKMLFTFREVAGSFVACVTFEVLRRGSVVVRAAIHVS